MEQMLKNLYEAAVEGNPATLLDLLQQDPLILDRFIVTSYEETPLHIAAILGHLEFCSELVRLKPELVKEVDCRRSSALHMASAKGYLEIVKILVSLQPEICLAYDGDGHNPIHVAAIKGRVDVLKALVGIYPDAASVKVRLHQGENLLHLCVQFNQLEALVCVVEAISDQELVNAADDNGNSILHLAMAEKHVEIIQYLVSKTPINIDAENSRGFTPLDILAQTKRDSKYLDIVQCLQHCGAKRSQEISAHVSGGRHLSITIPENHRNKVSMTREDSYLKNPSGWLEKQRNSLMVVASLIATMAFQATFAPPGGFWQENFEGNASQNPHRAGNSILADQHPDIYKRFMLSNTIGLISSLSVILLLISGLPFMHKALMWFLILIMWISISATAYTYSISVADNQGVVKNILDELIIGWIMMMALLIIGHTTRLIVLRMRDWPLKFKISAWIFVVGVWISCAIPTLSPINGLMILSGSLILLYSLTFVPLVGRKIKGCIKEVRGCFSSTTAVRTNV